jgi:hypothetical protein
VQQLLQNPGAEQLDQIHVESSQALHKVLQSTDVIGALVIYFWFLEGKFCMRLPSL